MSPVVNAVKCVACGKISYPMHFHCPKCGATKFEESPIEGTGRLLTWTRAYALALDYEALYITLGIIEMDNGVRATGQLDIPEPASGMRVRASVGPVRNVDGKVTNGLRFAEA